MQKKIIVVAWVNVHFSIVDGYKRRRNEALLVGYVTCFPRKFEPAPSYAVQSILKRFIYTLHA